jgi:hypothetical protein
VLFGPAAHASLAAITITVDENGNGFATSSTGTMPLTSSLLPDPSSGGLASVLTYSLGTLTVDQIGDVLIFEPGDVLGDDVRFGVPGGEHTLVLFR